jgi:glycosyltransferase involved in cell wall biosynthesis
MVSVVCPAYNEGGTVGKTVATIHTVMASTGLDYEIIVINDGSTDSTAEEASLAGATVFSHPVNAGYGAALKTGILKARYDWIAIIDSDGTYPIEMLPELLTYVPDFDMVVGARTGKFYWNSTIKSAARLFFLWLSEFVTGKHIPDINSGFRIFRKQIAQQHLARISNGFSFTTTLTLAMFLEGHFIKYVPVAYYPRADGKSKVRHFRDTLKALEVLVKAILYYNPIKLYLILLFLIWLMSLGGALLDWLSGGFLYWAILAIGFMLGIVTFGIGLVAEAVNKDTRFMSSRSLIMNGLNLDGQESNSLLPLVRYENTEFPIKKNR